MKIPQRVALQSPIRQLRVEYIKGNWRIWLTANGDFTLGTYIHLDKQGQIERVTWHEDGTETIFNMKAEQDNETD
jgi:hypothetical protein